MKRAAGVNMERMRGEKSAPSSGPPKPKVKDYGSRNGNNSVNRGEFGWKLAVVYEVAAGTSSKPVSIPSSGEEDEEDDFEEVAIPSAGPSTAPGTPGTPGRAVTGVSTPGTNTTAPSIDDDYAGYGEEEDEEKEDDGVIRLEFGGETPEEKAKRIALALRK